MDSGMGLQYIHYINRIALMARGKMAAVLWLYFMIPLVLSAAGHNVLRNMSAPAAVAATSATAVFNAPPVFDEQVISTSPSQEDTYEYQLPFVCSFDQQEALRQYPSNCGIIQDEFEDDWNWALRAGPTPSPGTGPQTDKSPNAQGYYIYFESSSPVQEGHYAIFATPWLSASHENVCVSFWFSMEGDIGMGLLDVLMDIPGQVEPQLLFQTDGPHGKEWLGVHEQIRIPVQHSFRIRFIATRGKSFRSDIAVDEIVVKEVKDQESCVPLARYPNTIKDSVLFCDIDTEGQCPMYHENSKKDYTWRATTMNDYRFGTGPDLGDHTKGRNGKYLVAKSDSGEPGASARVVIPLDLQQVARTNATEKNDLCVEFHYMTFGRQLGELNVNIWYRGVEHEFIKVRHATNRAWYQTGKVLLDFTEKNVSLILEAVRGGSNMSDIAVDDLHLFFCSSQDNPRYEISHAAVLTPSCRDGAIPCPEKDGCLLPEYVCDGVVHCINGSDEKFCENRCGIPMIQPNTMLTKIVHGQNVRPHSWPWQVALIDTADETQFCGGSIIHPFWILTAAHCLSEHGTRVEQQSRLNNMLIRVGDHSLLHNVEASQMDYYPSGLFIHPEFNKPFRGNDFGLIRLRQPILFRQEIQPVCLPWFSAVPVGSTCVVTGWGHTALAVSDATDENTMRSARYRRKRTLQRPPPNIFQSRNNLVRVPRVLRAQQDSVMRKFTTILSHTTDLQQLFLPIVPDEVCRNASQYTGMLSESMLCAGYLLSMVGDSCHGDSGGPLTCKRQDGSWEVHGITSFGGLRCAEEGHPGIYARVAHALDWISQTMGEDARVLKKRRADVLESGLKETAASSNHVTTMVPPSVEANVSGS